MELTDVGAQSNVTIKVEEDLEASEVKGCYIWISENTKPNFLDETERVNKEGPRVPLYSPKRRRCSIANCKNFLYKNNPSSGPRPKSFHKFPKDEITRAIWVKLCNRDDEFSTKSSLICSDHFKPEDYCLSENPLSEKRSNRLKPGVIPRLNLPVIRFYDPELGHEENKITQDERMELSNDVKIKKEDDLDIASLDSFRQNEDVLIVSSDDEDGVGSKFTGSRSSSRNEERINHQTDCSPDVVTISSSDEDNDDVDEAEQSVGINNPSIEVRKRRLDLLKYKYDKLQRSMEKLKTDTNEEIERLDRLIQMKEDEFSRELREVLSIFLKPEEVESIIEEAVL